jgi:hypothetical protein
MHSFVGDRAKYVQWILRPFPHLGRHKKGRGDSHDPNRCIPRSWTERIVDRRIDPVPIPVKLLGIEPQQHPDRMSGTLNNISRGNASVEP